MICVARLFPMRVAWITLVLSFPVAGQSPEQLESILTGGQHTTAAAAAREERLRSNPQDATARVELMAYHWRRQHSDPESAQRHGELVLWMIDNDPRNPLLATPYGHVQPHLSPQIFLRVKERSLEHLRLEPDDIDLLRNTAAMLADVSAISHDAANFDLAVSLLERAQLVDRRNSEWPFKLGFVAWLKAIGGGPEPDRKSAAAALSHFARAHRLGGLVYGPLALRFAMEAAFEAGEVSDARGYALQILDGDTASLRDHWPEASIVLGRIALIDDDTERAGEYLLAACRTLEKPSAFGPNMLLARELLERGEREVVLEYFELCAPFWERDRLDEWAAVVRAGQIPDFGANLRY